VKKTKNSYHHGDLRRRLINSAEEIITSQGLEALTLRLLSRRIGVSHTAAYRHFKGKHEIFSAIALEGFRELESRFQELDPKNSLAALDLIHAIGRAYVEFALENPARYRVMFGHVLLRRDRSPDLSQAARQAFNRLQRAIEDGQNNGQVRPGSAIELTSVGWSMAHGITQLLIDGQLLSQKGGPLTPALISAPGRGMEGDTARLVDTALDTMTAGLAAPKN